MKLFTKALIFLLIVTMSLTVLTSCGKSNTGTGSDIKDDNSGSADNSGSEEVTLIEDLEGYTFTLATLWQDKVADAGRGTKWEEKMAERIERIEKQYNCVVEIKVIEPVNAVDTVKNAIMSGDKYADFIQFDYEKYQNLIKGRYFQPIDELIDTNQEQYFASNTKAATVKGKKYGVEFCYPKDVGIICYYNRTIVEDKLGLEPVTSLVEEKKWTWDKFAEYCVAVKNSGKSGYGCIDWAACNFEKPFIYANGGKMAEQDANGKYVYALNSDKSLEALNFIRKLNNELKVKNPYNEETADVWQDLYAFKAGNIGFLFMEASNIATMGFDMEDEYGIAPIPMGPQASDYIAFDTQQTAWLMPVSNKNAATSAKLMNAFSKPMTGSAQKDRELYYEEMQSSMLNSDEDWDILEELLDKTVYDETWGMGGTYEISTAIYDCTRTTTVSAAEAMGGISGILQTYIDNYYDQE